MKKQFNVVIDTTMDMMIENVCKYVNATVNKKFPQLGEMMVGKLNYDKGVLEDVKKSIPFLDISFQWGKGLTSKQEDKFWKLEKKLSEEIDNKYFFLFLGIMENIIEEGV